MFVRQLYNIEHIYVYGYVYKIGLNMIDLFAKTTLLFFANQILINFQYVTKGILLSNRNNPLDSLQCVEFVISS